MSTAMRCSKNAERKQTGWWLKSKVGRQCYVPLRRVPGAVTVSRQSICSLIEGSSKSAKYSLAHRSDLGKLASPSSVGVCMLVAHRLLQRKRRYGFGCIINRTNGHRPLYYASNRLMKTASASGIRSITTY